MGEVAERSGVPLRVAVTACAAGLLVLSAWYLSGHDRTDGGDLLVVLPVAGLALFALCFGLTSLVTRKPWVLTAGLWLGTLALSWLTLAGTGALLILLVLGAGSD